MPIPQEQTPPESTKVLIEESELEALRRDSARYQALRQMDSLMIKKLVHARDKGFVTFDEMIDWQLVATPKQMRDTDGYPPVITGNENLKKRQQ